MKLMVMVIVAANSSSSSNNGNGTMRSSTLEKCKYANVEEEVCA
jgi:hypothetical protein